MFQKACLGDVLFLCVNGIHIYNYDIHLFIWYALYDVVEVSNLVKCGSILGLYDLATPFPNFYTLMEVGDDVQLMHTCWPIYGLVHENFSH